MTVDMGHGTIRMSGLYEDLMSECQLLSEPRLSPHQFERSLSFGAGRGLARFCVLCQGVRSSWVMETGRLLVIFMDLLS